MGRIFLALFLAAGAIVFCGASYPPPVNGTFVVKDYRFSDGQVMASTRLHYTTFGYPVRDARGMVTNAVLILHGTGGSAHQFLGPIFAGQLFGPGQPLDVRKYYLILPDDIGHGQSSKPSDGLHMRFPRYDYTDMVDLEHRLVVDGLHVNHLRLLFGTSMGCMHAWMWAEKYDTFADGYMPMACLPHQISGRNRMWRRMVMDAIRDDPGFDGGEYSSQPRGLVDANYIFMMVGSSPLRYQEAGPTLAKADAYFDRLTAAYMVGADANDTIYQVDASRDYDPEAGLSKIQAPVLAINSADDQINPPELHIAEPLVKLVPHGRFVLLPISDKTYGHGTHTHAEAWKTYLIDFLRQTEHT
ncbi:MAG TPA: alpha/beta fold hydrolase [Candidatus Eremiobacteraceae bacterium]|nr:alpha/beta fold hydrolase [Candidatus Eremiobacteraceae bacterium]